MGKKIVLPPEYRGARIGRGWCEEEPDHYDDIRELAVGLLKGKIEEVYDVVRHNREMKSNEHER